MIPRDKMKNITYGYAIEKAGLITRAYFVWITSLRHINYAVAHAQCLRHDVYAEDRHFLSLGVSSPLGRVIPMTIIKMVQTASLHRRACVRVGAWQCSPTVLKAGWCVELSMGKCT